MQRSSRVRVALGGVAVALLLGGGLSFGMAQSASATPTPACTGKDLTQAVYFAGGAGGTLYGDIELTNRTSTRCMLTGSPHSMYFTGDGHGDRVGAWGAHVSFEPDHGSQFSLAPRGGHVYARIGIAAWQNSGNACRPSEVTALATHVTGSSTAISSPLPRNEPITICSSTRIRELTFSQYRATRSTR